MCLEMDFVVHFGALVILQLVGKKTALFGSFAMLLGQLTITSDKDTDTLWWCGNSKMHQHHDSTGASCGCFPLRVLSLHGGQMCTVCGHTFIMLFLRFNELNDCPIGTTTLSFRISSHIMWRKYLLVRYGASVVTFFSIRSTPVVLIK